MGSNPLSSLLTVMVLTFAVRTDTVAVLHLIPRLVLRYTALTDSCTRNIHNGIIDRSSKQLSLFRTPVIDIRAASGGVLQPSCVGMNRNIQHIFIERTHHGISLIDTGIHTVAAGKHSFYMRAKKSFIGGLCNLFTPKALIVVITIVGIANLIAWTKINEHIPSLV